MKIPSDLVPVMEALTRAAERGLPCPSNKDVIEILGVDSVSTGFNALTRLEYIGAISVERFRTSRVVTITATGKQTYRRPEDVVEFKRNYVNRDEPWLSARVVDRDPCFRCGTRADYGCEHRAASNSMTLAEVLR